MNSELIDACKNGDLAKIKSIISHVNVNDVDEYLHFPAIFHAAYQGHLHIVKYLYAHGALLSVVDPKTTVNFLYCASSCPSVEKRKNMLNWLVEEERYLHIGSGVTRYHVDAALGKLPNVNNVNEVAKIADELKIENLDIQTFLKFKDRRGVSVAKYAILSGYELAPHLPLEILLETIENKENFLTELLIDRRSLVIKKIFESGKLKNVDFSRLVQIGSVMRTNLLFTFIVYTPSLLIDLYENNYIGSNNFLNLNYRLTDLEGNEKGMSAAYELMSYRNDEVSNFVMKLAAKMKDKGVFLDLNESPSDPRDKSYNVSLSQLFMEQGSVEELDTLLKWGPADQFINFNNIPAEGSYAGVPFGVLFAIKNFESLKQQLMRQLKISVPDISREEKIEKGWLLDLNKLVEKSKELVQGISIAWVICKFDPFLLAELMCSEAYKYEILNLDACPQGECEKQAKHSIASMLAVNEFFTFIDIMVDRDINNVHQVSLNKTYYYASKNKTRNLATILAKNDQFDLITKLADRNPTEQVELNPIGDPNDDCGLGFLLLTTGQLNLFKKFLERLPENYIFKLNSLTVAILANYDVALLRKLIERERDGKVIDLEFGTKQKTIKSILATKDKELIALIEERNAREINAGIKRCKKLVGDWGLENLEGDTDVCRKETIAVPKKQKISLAQAIKGMNVSGAVSIPQANIDEKPEATTVLKEKIEKLLTEKDITIDVTKPDITIDVTKPNDKFVVTFKGSEGNISKLNSVLKKYFNDKHFDKKNSSKVMSILISTESHLNAIFNDNALKKLLMNMQVIVSKKDKKRPDNPTAQPIAKSEPIILNEQKQAEWMEQLAYAFCKSGEVKVSWNGGNNTFIIKLPKTNKAWSVYGVSAKHNNLGYIVQDNIIEAIIKPLRSELSGIAKVEVNLANREIKITPNQNDVVPLKRLQEINYTQIVNNCESIVLEIPDNRSTFPKPPKQNRNKDEIIKSDDKVAHKIRTAELKSNLIEFLSSILRDINLNKADKSNKTDISDEAADSFSFLENLKSEIVDECKFSISFASRPTIGIFKTESFINTIAEHFNFIRTNFMRVDCDHDAKTLVITISKRDHLNDVFGASSYQKLKRILSSMQFDEQERRLSLIEAEAQERIKLKEDIIVGKKYTLNELTQVQQELMITLSRINEDDMLATDYHFSELKKIEAPSQAKDKDGNVQNIVKANDQIYYHLYLFHILQIMRILSSKIKKEDNVFWLMRNNILHAYKRLDWFEFHQKVDELVKTLNALITSKKLSATTLPMQFFAQNDDEKYHKFESLLTKIDEKHNRRIARQPYDTLLQMMQSSDFSYKQKRDFSIMIFMLKGETSDKHPERTIRDAIAHGHVHEYEKLADEIYKEFILVVGESSVKNTNTR